MVKDQPSAILSKVSDYTKKRCKDQGCELKFGSLVQSKTIIDVEKFWIDNNFTGKVTDCLILCTHLSRERLAVVELKGRSPNITSVVDKIQNVCNSLGEFFTTDFLEVGNFEFYPMLLSKSMSPIETRKLRTSRIKLGKPQPIIRENCGTTIHQIIRKYG